MSGCISKLGFAELDFQSKQVEIIRPTLKPKGLLFYFPNKEINKAPGVNGSIAPLNWQSMHCWRSMVHAVSRTCAWTFWAPVQLCVCKWETLWIFNIHRKTDFGTLCFNTPHHLFMAAMNKWFPSLLIGNLFPSAVCSETELPLNRRETYERVSGDQLIPAQGFDRINQLHPWERHLRRCAKGKKGKNKNKKNERLITLCKKWFD